MIPMARRRYSRRSCARPGRRAGLFLGGVLFGLARGIFFKNNY